MMINEAKPNKRTMCEMKVNLPVDLHIRLHELKILEGQRISDVVAQALATYFRKERAEAAGEG